MCTLFTFGRYCCTSVYYFILQDYYEKGRSKEYLERSYPMPLEPVHPEYYYGYPRPGAGYQGPYLYDMDSRQPLPAIGYAPEPTPAQWRWQ